MNKPLFRLSKNISSKAHNAFRSVRIFVEATFARGGQMRGHRDKMPAQDKASLGGRFASLAMAAVLLFLASFSVGIVVASKFAENKEEHATQLSNLYQEARYEVGAEESLERKYRLEPSPAVLAKYQDAANTLVEKLKAVKNLEPSEAANVDKILALHESYLKSISRMFAAVDAGDPRRVLAIDSGEVDPSFGEIDQLVNAAADQRQGEAEQRRADFTRVQNLVLVATPIIFIIGLALIYTFWSALRTYQNRVDQAQAEFLAVQADQDVQRRMVDILEQRVRERTAELSQTNTQLQVELGERKFAEQKLVYTSLHDPLTNLPNRVLFMDRLQHAMERAKRHKDNRFGVCFLDLDRFKVINDSLGHNIGDLLLIESAHRLTACLRDEDTVARLGGDEFVILLEDVQDPINVGRVMDRIQHDLTLPYALEGHKIFVSVSMGIVLSGAEYKRTDDILRDADIAMYRAKGLGRGRYEMFNSAMLVSAMTRLELEADLRKALEHQEFIIHYQPILELENGRIVGFEALVRWQHPTRLLVSPAEFIPMAEETGLIVSIGHWVLTEACRQIRQWQVQFPANPPLTINVNLSARQCAQTDLVQQIARVLQESGVDARDLKLELTESVVVENADSTSVMLSELRAMGVQVQIDDFGTGYSSLGYLQRLPIDTLKIDRTFVSRIGNDGSGSDIVRTILALAHDLGKKVVAEGIETDEQLSTLISMECEYGQGYLFSRPMDSRTASTWLTELFAAVTGSSDRPYIRVPRRKNSSRN
jgi:diguanylate cyclase (GGDEF)-like protein